MKDFIIKSMVMLIAALIAITLTVLFKVVADLVVANYYANLMVVALLVIMLAMTIEILSLHRFLRDAHELIEERVDLEKDVSAIIFLDKDGKYIHTIIERSDNIYELVHEYYPIIEANLVGKLKLKDRLALLPQGHYFPKVGMAAECIIEVRKF